jgi:Sec-independent protein translocase protein TatA
MLSFGEILLILLVAILILKPEDLPSIMKYFLKLKKQVFEIKEYFGKVFQEIEEKTLNKDLNKDDLLKITNNFKKNYPDIKKKNSS